jgi:hypothetical protein
MITLWYVALYSSGNNNGSENTTHPGILQDPRETVLKIHYAEATAVED